MSNPSNLLFLTGVLVVSLGIVSAANAAHADPPGRVARLNDIRGKVSYSPAGEDEWIGVVRNRPLVRGDRLWTDRDARAEFQVSSSAIRLGSYTSIEILDLNDNILQLQLTQGSLNLRVRRLYRGQIIEIATPTLAFTINHAGRYRIDVDPYDDQTTIVVWEGAGEAYGDNASFPLRTGDTVRFYDPDLRDYKMYGLPRKDDFDRYSLERDRRLDHSVSLRYVDDDMAGYADLDEYGSWRPVRSYGTVWFPTSVAAGWAPYRDGHWVWQEPWGWTWVDNAPWGFAPSHYGRWVNLSHQWGWIPGPRNVRPVYAPALVAFIGGSGWSLSISLGGGSSPIGWFPLGPREVYVPSYRVSRDYFTRVNVTNTVINNTTITNVYYNYSDGAINVNRGNYANLRVTGAVTVVPGTVFVSAQSVGPAAIRLDRNTLATGEITHVAPIAPGDRSVIGAGKTSRVRPSRKVFDRKVVARNTPPVHERPFAARKQQLQNNPGLALEPGAVEPAQSHDTNTTRNVRIIDEQQNAVDTRAAGSRRANKTTQLRPLERQAAEQQQEQRQAVEQQPSEPAGQTGTRQQIAKLTRAERRQLANCERKAVQQNNDESKCLDELLVQQSNDNANRE